MDFRIGIFFTYLEYAARQYFIRLHDICHTPNPCLRPRPCTYVLASPTTAAFVPTYAASDPTTSAILTNGFYESHGGMFCEVIWMGPASRNV